jgi:hypothetical protein
MTPDLKIITLQSALSDLLIAVQNRRPSLGELAVATSALAETMDVTPEELHAENARISAERSRVWQSTRTPPMEVRA